MRILESVLDWQREELSSALWRREERFYKLKPWVRAHILNQLRSIPKQFISDIIIIGSITSRLYNDETDIDVHILTDELDNYEHYKDMLKNVSGNALPGSKHPLNYYIHEPGHKPYYNSAYGVINDRWIKWEPLERVNIRDYYSAFKTIVDKIDLERAELYRNIIDFEELRGAIKQAGLSEVDEIYAEIKRTLKDINEQICNLINRYEQAKDRRQQALHGRLAALIQAGKLPTAMKYKTAHELPDNIVYLLLRKYGYQQFLSALKKLTKKTGDIDTPNEIGSVKALFGH